LLQPKHLTDRQTDEQTSFS